MAAFDWSPGGCCCDVATWWYDIYQFDSRSPKHLDRIGCVAKVNQPGDSFDGDQWFITPASPTTPTPLTFQLYGYGSTNPTVEQLWSVEQRGGIYYVVLYDCVAKSEISITPITTVGVAGANPYPRIYSQINPVGPFSPIQPAVYNSVSAGPTAFALVAPSGGTGGASLEIVSGGLVTKQDHILAGVFDGVNFGPGFYFDLLDNAHILAARSWPRVAGVSARSYTVQTNGQQSVSMSYTTKFTVGDLTVDNNFNQGSGPLVKAFKISNQLWSLDLTFSLQILTGESTTAPTTSNPRWMYFDANGDKWIGVIQWETFVKVSLGGGNVSWRAVSHIALLINGTIIKQYDDCAAFQDGTDTFTPNGPWSSVHAMFNGYCAVVANIYDIDPGQSFPSGKLKSGPSTRLRIYNGSALVWESPLATSASTYHSSDRWLYAQINGMDFHDMPPCAFDHDIARIGHTLNVRNHWLIRPDGTACAPMGIRETDATLLPAELDTGVFVQHNPMFTPKLGFETIKRSSLIPDVPPVEPF